MPRTILLILFLTTLHAPAQLMDSLPKIVKGKAGLDARLESRYSFIGGEVAAINGFRLGITFERKLRLGGGLSWLNTDLDFYEAGTDPAFARRRFLKFGYACAYADFVFHKTKRWQLSVPLQLGAGLMWKQRKSAYDLGSPDPRYFFMLYEPGISVQFKIFKWFGLGNDVAYRFVLRNDPLSQRLSSPTYSFKILFWPEQLFFVMFPASKVTDIYGPAYW